MRPPSGTIAPEITLISVDLPAPLSPIKANTSPGRSVRLIPLRARTAPKFLVTSSSSRRLLIRLVSAAPTSQDDRWCSFAILRLVLHGQHGRLDESDFLDRLVEQNVHGEIENLGKHRRI